ncbi:MAG: TylF/MycF/NovP-related O-methyltransferase [Chitinophagaceae bacterium]
MLLKKILKATGLTGIARSMADELTSARGNLDKAFPSDFSPSEEQHIGFVKSKTMTSPERLVTLSRAIDHIELARIEGDIVECGVWKGGSMMLVARKLLEYKNSTRQLFLFDTYEGMSEPGSADVSAVDHSKAEDLLKKEDRLNGDNVWCYSPVDEVKANLTQTGYPLSSIHFIKGKVEETLPHPEIRRIALLRLDTDWYESTKHELETLYDLLVPGGILIIDDYGHWSGARKAVDEFFAERGIHIFLNRIDYTGRIAIKPN